jgi:hypothetical protein
MQSRLHHDDRRRGRHSSTCDYCGISPCQVNIENSENRRLINPLVGDPRSKSGLVLKMGQTQQWIMTGPCFPSWHSRTEPICKWDAHIQAMVPANHLSRSTEDFSYFTLRKAATTTRKETSLFGISCTRQMDASALINRPADVTRSTVQKAVVVIADSPQYFGQLRERLAMVTNAWFAQK